MGTGLSLFLVLLAAWWPDKPRRSHYSVAATTETLKEHLKLSELPLATTEEGKRFCMKALHPSDSQIRSARVPGRNANTVVIAIDHVFEVPVGSEGWVDINVIPHPFAPVGVYNSSDTWIFYSPPFGGGLYKYSSYSEMATKMNSMCTAFTRLIEGYCITSQSVTCELIAPATASQGTVIASQYSNPVEYYYWTSASHPEWGISRGAMLEQDPIPSVMAAGSRAYSAKALDGCYMPLRLNNFDIHHPSREWVTRLNMSDEEIPLFWTDDCMSHALARPYYLDPAADNKCHTLVPSQDNWGKISFRGMSSDASLRIRARQTLELIVDPESSYAPLAETPCPPDDLAHRMYYEISARMKDAYPASYNDWDSLKKTIIAMGKKILPLASPALGLLTNGMPFGGALNSLGQAALQGLRKKLEVSVSPQQDASTKAALAPLLGVKALPAPKKKKKKRSKSKKQKVMALIPYAPQGAQK